MTGWILYDLEQYHKNQWFADKLLEYGNRFARMKLILAESLQIGIEHNAYCFMYSGRRLSPPDFAVSRTIYPLLSLVLEKAGTRVFNNSLVSAICNDKRQTYTMVRSDHVEIANTLFFDKRFLDPEQLKGLSFPAILKSASGHGGKEVFYIDHYEELAEHLDLLPTDDFLLQEVCRPYGKDLRVYLMGGEILSAVLRSSEQFKSNYSLGGSAQVYSLNREEEQMVRTIVRSFPSKMDFVGIDFLFCDGRLIFNEIEDVVGTRMLYHCTKIDAAEQFMEYIREALQK